MFRSLFFAAAAGFASTAPPLPASAVTSAPTCTASALSLIVTRSNDNGTMHDARFLTLKNTSDAACSVPGHPHVSLSDERGNSVVANATTAAPRFMHPGPVIVPRNLAPGGTLTLEIRWLRDDGSPSHASCSAVAAVSLEGARAPLDTTICADGTTGAKPQLEIELYRT